MKFSFKLCAFFFCILLVSLFSTCIVTANEYNYAYIDKVEVIENNIQITTVDTKGFESIYSCMQNIYINGELYTLTDEALSIIKTKTYSKFKLNSENKIIEINWQIYPMEYKNVLYNKDTKTFECDLILPTNTNLPIFYNDGNTISTPFMLEGEFYYDIKVYAYAIEITNFKSLYYPCTIKQISDLRIELTAVFENECYVTEIGTSNVITDTSSFEEEYYYTTKIYNNDSLVGYKNMSTDYYFFLPNSTTDYTIEIFMTDSKGTQISNCYTTNFSTEKTMIKTQQYGYVYNVAVDTAYFEDKAALVIIDSSGNRKVYYFASTTQINGIYYKNYDLISYNYYDVIPILADCKGKYVQFSTNSNNEITSIAWDLESINYYKEFSYDIFSYFTYKSTLKTSIYVKNNTGENIESVLYFAIYDANGTLKALKTENTLLYSEQTNYFNFNFENYKYANDDIIKVYLWDNTQKPLGPICYLPNIFK